MNSNDSDQSWEKEFRIWLYDDASSKEMTVKLATGYMARVFKKGNGATGLVLPESSISEEMLEDKSLVIEDAWPEKETRQARQKFLFNVSRVKKLALEYAKRYRNSMYDRVGEKFIQRLHGRSRVWVEEICDSRKKIVVMYSDDPRMKEELKSGSRQVIERGAPIKLVCVSHLKLWSNRCIGTKKMQVTDKQLIEIMASKIRKFVEEEVRSQPSVGQTIL